MAVLQPRSADALPRTICLISILITRENIMQTVNKSGWRGRGCGPTSQYKRPRVPPPQGFRPRGGVNSSYPGGVNLEGNVNLRVSSAPQGRGFGRGRGFYGVNDYQGSRGRGLLGLSLGAISRPFLSLFLTD